MNTIKVGDQVTLPEGQQGMVRYVGRVDGKPGEFAGIELLKGWEAHGRHSGVYNGVSYFRTESPNTGLFISYPKLVALNNHRGGTSALGSLPGSPVFATPKARPSQFTTPRTMPLRHSLIPNSPVSERNGLFESPSKRRVSGVFKSRVSSINSLGSSASMSDHSQAQMQELRDEIEQLKTAVKEREEQIRDRDNIIEEAESSLNQFSELVSRNEQLVDELDLRDRKISDLQHDISEKRREFRDTLDALESEYMASSQDYQKEVEQLRSNLGHAETVNETIVEMEGMVASLESGLRISKVNEQEAKERLGLMADIENRLLEKEQELVAVKDRLEKTRGQLDEGAGTEQLKKDLTRASESETLAKAELKKALKELAELKESGTAKAETQQALEKAEKDLAAAQKELANLKTSDSSDMTAEVAELKKELAQTQEMSLNEQDQSMKTIDTLRKQMSEMKAQLKEKNAQLGEHHVGGTSPSKDDDKGLAIANKKIANLEKDKMYLTEEANEVKYQMAELKKKVYSLEDQLREAQESAAEGGAAVEKDIHAVDGEKHIKLANDYDALFEEHNKLTDKHQDLELELEDMKLQLEESKLGEPAQDTAKSSGSDAVQAEVKLLTSQVAELKQKLDKVTSTKDKLSKDVEKLESELESKILKEYELEKELEDAKSASAQISSSQGNGSVPAAEIPSTPSKGSSDPAAGRELWCGLCERPGHESISCPFENEEF